MARISNVDKLKRKISLLEKERQSKIDELLEMIMKEDPDIVKLTNEINNLKKVVKAKDDLEQKAKELEQEMISLLNEQ